VELAELSERLVAFCADRYDDPDVVVSEVETMPGHAGFAYGFAVTHAGGTDRWFLRLPPPNVRWEGTADMLRQVTALQALDGSDVPHCRVQWFGGPDDLEWFGRPYFVVEQLRGGDVVGIGASVGWVGRLGAAQRVEMARQAMAALAGIHRLEWRARCGYLGEPVGLERDVTRWDRFVERAADPAALADVPRVRQLLLDRLPHDVHVGLFHGDFQFGNLYYSSDGELQAVLDWELCGIGATLNDVGWVATFNDPAAWQHDGAVPDGMPRADELIDQYREACGEPVADVDWFRALAAYKFAIITGFNLGLHRRGKRPDPLWERIGGSIGSLQARALQLLGG
jgi:aminoglycoside phosphotransferase (APT) family kinase protein